MKTTIARLQGNYLIPAGHPEPAALRARLDSVAHDYLPDICSTWLTRLLDAQDTSIWLIHRLDVEVSLNVGSLDRAALAELWGRQLVKAIIRALTPDDELDPERVRHFPDYDAYLAHFISDLAAGRAWEQWYYRTFDSLRSLPPSAAIRTVMTREPERIAAVFALLAAQKRLEPVLHCLTARDAHTLYTQGYSVGAYEAQANAMQLEASVNESAVHSRADTSRFRAETAQFRAENPSQREQPLSVPELRLNDDESPARAEEASDEAHVHAQESHVSDDELHPPVGQPLNTSTQFGMVQQERHEKDESVVDGGVRDMEGMSYEIAGRAAHGRVVGGVDEGRHSIELVLSVWNRATLQLSGTNIATPHNALRLYTALWEQVARSSPFGLREAIEHLLRFTELLRVIAQPDLLVSCLIEHNLTAAIELLRGAQDKQILSYLPSLSYLQQSAAGDTALLRRVVSTAATSTALASRSSTPGSGVNSREEQHITTLLGGLFLLLPSFIDLKFPELLANAPYPDMVGEHTTPLLRYLIFLKCFGLLHAQWPGIAHDPLLLLVSNAEDMPLTQTLQQLSQSATAQMSHAWQRLFIEQLARYRYIEGRSLFAELVEMETSTVLLIRDMRSDAWLYIRSVPREADAIQATLMQGVTMLQEVIGLPPESLVLGAGLEVGTDVSRPRSAGRDTSVPTSISPLPAADKDLHYLTLYNPPSPGIEQRDLDLTLSLFARTLLRAFARRLMGFDQSSAEYLYQNFLAGTSSVVIRPDLVEVQLPCSPLHLVLRIAGMHEQSYTLPWCGDMHVSVTLAC